MFKPLHFTICKLRITLVTIYVIDIIQEKYVVLESIKGIFELLENITQFARKVAMGVFVSR